MNIGRANVNMVNAQIKPLTKAQAQRLSLQTGSPVGQLQAAQRRAIARQQPQQVSASATVAQQKVFKEKQAVAQQNLATDQLKILNEKLNEANKNRANTTSGEDQAIYSALADGYAKAREFAGLTDTKQLLDVAQAIADARISRVEFARTKGAENLRESIKAQTKLREIELSKGTQPASSFVTDAGVGMSIVPSEFKKLVESGKIKESGTFRDTSGQTYRVDVPSKVSQFREDIDFDPSKFGTTTEQRLAAVDIGKARYESSQQPPLDVVSERKDVGFFDIIKSAPKTGITSTIGGLFTLGRKGIREGERNLFGKEVGAIAEPVFEATMNIVNLPTTKFIERERTKGEKRIEDIRTQGFYSETEGAEFFGGRPTSKLLPYESSGTQILTKFGEPKQFTEEKLGGFLFGGGEKELIRRKERDIQFELENLSNKTYEELKPKFKSEIEIFKSFLQNKLELGKITVEEANAQLEEKNIELNNKFQEEVNNIVNKKQKVLVDALNLTLITAARSRKIKEAAVLAPVVAGTIFGLGVLGGVPFGIGTGIEATAGTLFGLQMKKDYPELVKEVKEDPFGTIVSTAILFGAGAAGGAVGGRIGGKIGNRFKSYDAIDDAISRARTKQTIISNNQEFVLKNYNLNKLQQLELKNILDKGGKIRVVRSKLIPQTTADTQLLPKVISDFIEVIGRDGKIVQRINLGRFVAEQKGRIYTQDILQKSIAEVESRLQFTKTYKSKLKKGAKGAKQFKPIEEVATLEEFKQTKIRKIEGAEQFDLITGRSKQFLIEEPLTLKVIGNKLTASELRNFLKLQRKRTTTQLTKTETITLKKLLTKAEIQSPVTSTSGIIGIAGEQLEVTKGLTEFITGKKPPTSSRRITTPTTTGDLILTSFDIESTFTDLISTSVNKIKSIKGKPKPTKTTKVDSINKAFGTEQILETTQPKIVSGVKGAESEFIGLGIFERGDTSGGLLPGFIRETAIAGLTRTTISPTMLLGTSSFSISKTKVDTKNSTKLISPIVSQSFTAQIPTQTYLQPQLTFISPALAQAQQQQSKQVSRLSQVGISGIGLGSQLTLIKPKIPTPIMFLKDKGDEGKKVFGYNAFVKTKGKFIKVTPKATSRTKALNKGAFIVDNSTSRQFKIIPTGKKINKPKTTGSFFENNTKKFRQFKQTKGKRQFTPVNYIERSKFAIDTPSEKQGITVKGLLAKKRNPPIRNFRKKKFQGRRSSIRNTFGF